MTQQQAIALAIQLAISNATHPDYERVVNMAKDNRTLITGEDIGRLLIQFVQRENEEMFKQRVRITQATTPAIIGSIMKPFYKVSRNDKIKKRFNYQDAAKNELVGGMIKGYFGSKRKKNKGLDYWFKTRFVQLSFDDPNAWVVDEWAKPEANQAAEPHPFEISAEEARNFKIVNEDLKWLFARVKIAYLVYDGETATYKDGFRFTLYEEDNTIVLEKVDQASWLKAGNVLAENQSFTKLGEEDYLLSAYEPKLGFVSAFRVGYVEDPATMSRTYVTPFHLAMAFLKKSIKTVSELDLTMTLHTFPQKLQYVEKCTGESKNKSCHSGYVNGTADKCGACGGKGYQIHTSAQDAILIPMPQDKEDMIDLEKMIVYKAPPIELIKFQDEYTKGLKVEAHMAVFNSTIFVSPDGLIAKTATEVNDNMESVYDTLEPFTEKISEVYMERVHTFAKLAAVEDPDNDQNENIHQYPGDLKLKSMIVLLNELKLVNESGAPSFMRDIIGTDLADIMYIGDDLALRKYETKHKFFPFNGKGPEEIAMLMSSQYVSEFTKVLYSNYDAIFTDIEIEHPEFYLMQNYSKQWEIVEAATREYMEELNLGEQVQIDLGNTMNPGGEGGDADDAAGKGNPGEEDNDAAVKEPEIAA